MNTDMLTTSVADVIAVITLGSAKQIYFNAEMGDVLTAELEKFAGDPGIRVVVVTGGAPGYFNRHFSIPALLELAEAVRASGRQWADNATYHGGFFDRAMALCETMPKPVIAAISGTPWPGPSSLRSLAIFASPRMATTCLDFRKRNSVLFPALEARRGCRESSECRLPLCTS